MAPLLVIATLLVASAHLVAPLPTRPPGLYIVRLDSLQVTVKSVTLNTTLLSDFHPNDTIVVEVDLKSHLIDGASDYRTASTPANASIHLFNGSAGIYLTTPVWMGPFSAYYQLDISVWKSGESRTSMLAYDLLEPFLHRKVPKLPADKGVVTFDDVWDLQHYGTADVQFTFGYTKLLF